MLRIAIQNFLLKPTYKHQFSNPDCYTTIQHLYYCLFAQIGINLVYNNKKYKKMQFYGMINNRLVFSSIILARRAKGLSHKISGYSR